MPQDRSTTVEPTIMRTRLQRLHNLVALQADPDWARLYVQELLDQEPGSPDAHGPRFAGLIEESGDRTVVVAETVEALADEMAALVTNEIPMSAIEMIDLDTEERRQAHTKAEVGFLLASQPDIPQKARA